MYNSIFLDKCNIKQLPNQLDVFINNVKFIEVRTAVNHGAAVCKAYTCSHAAPSKIAVTNPNLALTSLVLLFIVFRYSAKRSIVQEERLATSPNW